MLGLRLGPKLSVTKVKISFESSLSAISGGTMGFYIFFRNFCFLLEEHRSLDLSIAKQLHTSLLLKKQKKTRYKGTLCVYLHNR